jgi:hypothetical protein
MGQTLSEPVVEKVRLIVLSGLHFSCHREPRDPEFEFSTTEVAWLKLWDMLLSIMKIAGYSLAIFISFHNMNILCVVMLTSLFHSTRLLVVMSA